MDEMEYGLIGEKLGHSYSPMIHGMLGDYRYELRELAPEELGPFLRAGRFRGLNVTIPYKRAAVPFCDHLTETAIETGCVNTLIKQKNGKLTGHNTDIGGFMRMLRRAGIDPSGMKCVILGSGGTSHTALTALRHMGAGSIVVVSRSGPVTYADLMKDHTDAQLLINTTPVGMYPNNGKTAADIGGFRALEGVTDVVYNPEKTALILEAEKRGLRFVSGLPMLVAQARLASEAFFDRAIDPAVEDVILREIRSSALNLVLIGMPGAGKSTLGAMLSRSLGRPFVDLDERIAEKAGLSIPEIFERYGQARFRDLESEIIQDVCRSSGHVISAGGGAVLRDENVRAMRQNGRMCHLRRPIDLLALDGRPNSVSREAVRGLWEQRKALYAAAADYTVDNDSDMSEAANRIWEGFRETADH